jgi:hypothetical protein
VERAFFEAGKALTELRDRRLYRSTHKTFEEYCRVRPWRWRSHRFAHSRQQSNYLIAAAGVYENLTTIGCQNVANENLTTNGSQILPTSERQVRPMTKLEPQEQQEVWLRAVELAGGKVPTGRIVKDAVQRIMERTRVPNTYQLGEVCQILAKDNPELRGKGGCWGIVSQVNEFSCTVKTWNGQKRQGSRGQGARGKTETELVLRPSKSALYGGASYPCSASLHGSRSGLAPPAKSSLPLRFFGEQMQVICDRISRVYSGALEESVQKFLESLGKLNRAYLTDLEEKVLSLLELEIIP